MSTSVLKTAVPGEDPTPMSSDNLQVASSKADPSKVRHDIPTHHMASHH
jgi:hypothetical protein